MRAPPLTDGTAAARSGWFGVAEKAARLWPLIVGGMGLVGGAYLTMARATEAVTRVAALEAEATTGRVRDAESKTAGDLVLGTILRIEAKTDALGQDVAALRGEVKSLTDRRR